MADYRPWFYDFYHLWAAGKLATSRANPYDVTALEAVMVELPGWNREEFVFGFLQLPQTLWLYALMSLFPFQFARVAWGTLNLFLTFASIQLLHRWDDKSDRTSLDLSTLFVLSLFPFVWSNFVWGQYNTICLWSLLVSLQLWGKKAYGASGFIIAFTLFKPHLCIPALAYLSTLSILNRRATWFIGILGCTALQTAIVFRLNPGIFHLFLANLSVRSSEAVQLIGAAPVQLLIRLFDAPSLGVLATLLAVLLGSYFAYRDGKVSTNRFLFVLMPLGVLLAPYSWGHTFLLLLPAALPLSRSIGSRIGRLAPPSFALASLLLFIASLVPKAEPFLSPVPVLICAYLAAARPKLDFSVGRG